MQICKYAVKQAAKNTLADTYIHYSYIHVHTYIDTCIHRAGGGWSWDSLRFALVNGSCSEDLRRGALYCAKKNRSMLTK